MRGGVELWQLSRRLHGVDLNLEHPMKMHTAATGTLVVLGLMLTACSGGDAEITASHQSPNETADQAARTQSPLEETAAEELKANERLVEAIFTSGIQLDYHPLASPQEAMAAPLVVVGQVRSARVASGDAGPEVRLVVDVTRHVAREAGSTSPNASLTRSADPCSSWWATSCRQTALTILALRIATSTAPGSTSPGALPARTSATTRCMTTGPRLAPSSSSQTP